MSRNLLRSDYDAGEPAWIEWLVVGTLLALALTELLSGGDDPFLMLPAASGLAFGAFLVVVELGKLRPTDST